MAQTSSDPIGLRSVFAQLQQRTHAGLVIASAAIMDSQLELCIKQAMRPMSKKLYAELFDPMRALGNLASKITMAYALGIIERDVYLNLELMRKIRNAFAHSSQVLHFDSPPIAPLFEQLKKSTHLKSKSPDAQFMECVVPIDRTLDAYLTRKQGPAS